MLDGNAPFCGHRKAIGLSFSAIKFSTLLWKWQCSWRRQPAGAEVGLEFGRGSRGRQLWYVSGRRRRVFMAWVEPRL